MNLIFFQLINLAQWRYSNQWPFREVELLLVENFNQYPARLTWNTVIRCNFCPVPSGTNNHLYNCLTQYMYPKLVLHRDGCYIITRTLALKLISIIRNSRAVANSIILSVREQCNNWVVDPCTSYSLRTWGTNLACIQ